MIIFHVDANSAYLSWTAARLISEGYGMDIREVPSVIAGDPDNRHGIILAKSIPAKRYGIETADTLMEAFRKYPDLCVFPPDYDHFLLCSDAMDSILREYTPVIQRYSIDESFLDMTASVFSREEAVFTGNEIRKRIRKELGFTVNVGIGENKLCAKMAGELKKPDMLHTIWPDEVREKLWPLPCSELFMVGRRSAAKLDNLGIKTIGDIAEASPELLKASMKSHGLLIHRYANGIDNEKVVLNRDIPQKGAGNGLTFSYDIEDREELYVQALSLCERVCMRVRAMNCIAEKLTVHLRSSDLFGYSHQMTMQHPTVSTDTVWNSVCRLIDECWRGEPVRAMSISLGKLEKNSEIQLSCFDDDSTIDITIDSIRSRFGNGSIMRGVFANSDIPFMQGGVNDGNYIMMGGYGGENSSKTG